MKLVSITPSFSLDDTLTQELQDVIAATQQMYVSLGYRAPWISYMAFENGSYVGICSFVGSPKNNEIEIAYHTFKRFEGKGIATQMARALLEIAKSADPGIVIFAHTRPKENASTSILRKLGFHRESEFLHPEDGLIWRWRRASLLD